MTNHTGAGYEFARTGATCAQKMNNPASGATTGGAETPGLPGSCLIRQPGKATAAASRRMV